MKVGVHQGSALSPLLLTIVVDMVTKEVRGGLPWELLQVGDLTLEAITREGLRSKLALWLC